jgi:hypothetical protein
LETLAECRPLVYVYASRGNAPVGSKYSCALISTVPLL